MVMAEEVSPDLISIVLPTVLGVAMVLITVAIVFWIGTGNQRSYEEAKQQASRKAEEVLKEKEHVSPRAKKPRKNFRKKKSGDPQEEPEPPKPKGILKAPSATGTEASPERPTPNKVEFKLDTPSKEDGKTPRLVSPPTPHPNPTLPAPPPPNPAAVKPPQPLFEEPEPVAVKEPQRAPAKAPEPISEPQKPKAPEPQKPKHQAPVKTPAPTEAKKKADTAPPKKSRSGKVKTPSDGQDVFPASRITDIVGASLLSDEEIQRLIELLLEKSNANSEWEAANLKAESNKSLKKQNQELHSKLEEAQKAVMGHSSKIKELRREMQTEKNRHQTSEQSFQAKLSQQSNELSIFKTRASGLEEELRQTNALASPQNLQKMSEENSLLSTQITHLQQQVGTLNLQLKELVESNRAKDAALKASAADSGLMVKVAEKENLLEQRNRDIEQLTNTVQRSHLEITRLKKELREVHSDMDVLKQKASHLETTESQLHAEVQKASLAKDESLSRMEALREEFEQTRDQEIARERAELQAQHQDEVDKLRKGLAEVDALHKSVGTLEERNKELETQVEKCSSLEQQVALLGQKLEAEQAAKKDLQDELELQAKTKPNGPVVVETLSNGDDEPQATAAVLEAKKEVAILEKKLEDLKNKNNELSESLWKAKDEAGMAEKAWEGKLKQAQDQVESKAASAKVEALTEASDGQKALLKQLFPEVSVEGCDNKYELWVERFEGEAQGLLSRREEENTSLKEKVRDLEIQRDENTKEIRHFRDTLQTTMEILKKLQAEVETSNAQHQVKLEEKEAALEAERTTNRHLQEELRGEREVLDRVRGELDQEKQAVSRVQEQLEASREESEGGAANQEEVAALEERLREVEQGRKDMEEQVAYLHEVMKKKEEAEQKVPEVETSNAQHQVKLEEKEAALEAERTTNRHLQEELRGEREVLDRVRGELDQEKQAVSRVQEQLEASREESEGGAANQEEVAALEERLREVEQGRKDMEEQVAYLHEVMKKKEEAEQKLESRVTAECKLKEEAISNADQLEQEKKELVERLDTMKQSNRQLNARIATLAGPSPTDSEV